MSKEILEPCGRPPLTCTEINQRNFRRHSWEKIMQAREKKCFHRQNHRHYPCESILDEHTNEFKWCTEKDLPATHQFQHTTFKINNKLKNSNGEKIYTGKKPFILNDFSEDLYKISSVSSKENSLYESFKKSYKYYFPQNNPLPKTIEELITLVEKSCTTSLKKENIMKTQNICDNLQNKDDSNLNIYVLEILSALFSVCICLWDVESNKWNYVNKSKTSCKHSDRKMYMYSKKENKIYKYSFLEKIIRNNQENNHYQKQTKNNVKNSNVTNSNYLLPYSSDNFDLQETKADGDCAYNAFIQGMNEMNIVKDNKIKNFPKTAEQLRRKLLEYFEKKNHKKYNDVIFRIKKGLDSSFSIDSWAQNEELEAFVDIYDVCICVWSEMKLYKNHIDRWQFFIPNTISTKNIALEGCTDVVFMYLHKNEDTEIKLKSSLGLRDFSQLQLPPDGIHFSTLIPKISNSASNISISTVSSPWSSPPTPPKSKSPTPPKSKSPTPPKSKSPTPPKSKSPTPPKSKSPTPPKSKSPTPPKSKSPTPPIDDSTPEILKKPKKLSPIQENETSKKILIRRSERIAKKQQNTTTNISPRGKKRKKETNANDLVQIFTDNSKKKKSKKNKKGKKNKR